MSQPFDPSATLDASQIRECLEELGDHLIERPPLRVLGVPPDALLLMKLNRSSAPDIADMRRLWPLSSYATADEIVTAFYAAYPDEERDEYLIDHVRGVLGLVDGNRGQLG